MRLMSFSPAISERLALWARLQPGTRGISFWINGCGAIGPMGAEYPSVASVTPEDGRSAGYITLLSDLPPSVWTLGAEPPPGYHYKTTFEIGGCPEHVLLDGGAAFSVITEETLVRILNKARRNGLTAKDADWPLALLEHWNGVSEAAHVGNGQGLVIFAVCRLVCTLVGVNGGRKRWNFKVRVARAGTGRFNMLIVGAPELDQYPLGLGHKATLGKHFIGSLNLTLPRLESDQVSVAFVRRPSPERGLAWRHSIVSHGKRL